MIINYVSERLIHSLLVGVFEFNGFYDWRLRLLLRVFLLVKTAIRDWGFWTVFETLSVVSLYLEIFFHSFLALWGYLFVLVAGWSEFESRRWRVVDSIWGRSNRMIHIISTQILPITTDTWQIRWCRPLLISSSNHTSSPSNSIPCPHSNRLLIHLFL